MKRWVVGFIFTSIVCTATVAAAKGLEVDLVDNKLSINAEAISLSRLLQLVDMATGMKSKVPPELAGRNLSVKFSNLSLTDGLRKMFQGQPFDYVVIQGQGIIVTAASQTVAAAGAGGEAAPPNPPPAVQSFDQPFVQDFPQNQNQNPPGLQQLPQQQIQQQPMVQTPFGPIPNPRAQQPTAPVPAPAQQNPLFPGQLVQPGQQGQPVIGQPVPGFPNPQPSPGQFGTPNPFGTPNVPAGNQNNPGNGLFGSVPVFPSPGTQQQR